MYKSFVLILFCIIAFVARSVGQNVKKTDSLKQVINTNKARTAVASARVELADLITASQPDSALFQIEQALQILRQPKDKEYLAKAYKIKGVAYWHKGSMEEAKTNTRKAIELFEQLKKYDELPLLYFNMSFMFTNMPGADSAMHYTELSKQLALEVTDSAAYIRALTAQTSVLRKDGRLKEAAEHSYEVLHYAEKRNDLKLLFTAYAGLGNISSDMGEYENAVQWFEKAYRAAQELDAIYSKVIAVNNLALAYAQLQDMENLKIYRELFLEYAAELDRPAVTLTGLINMGEYYLLEKNYDAAEQYLSEAEQTAIKHELKSYIPNIYITLAGAYIGKGMFASAEAKLQDAERLAKQFKNPKLLSDVYSRYVRLDTIRDEYKSAFRYYRLQRNILDSMRTLDTENTIKELNVRYETEKKNKELQLLSQEKINQDLIIRNQRTTLYAVAVVGILLFGFTFVVLAGRQKLKLKNIEISEQKQEIQLQADNLEENLKQIQELNQFKDELAQMLVHDLKNPLNIILNLPESISVKQKEQFTRYSALKMHNLVMNILEVRKYEEAALKLNIEHTTLNEIIEEVHNDLIYSFQDTKVDFVNNIRDTIEIQADKSMISRVLVNLLTNALNYTPAGGKIEVDSEPAEENFIKVTVSDTGHGIPESVIDSLFVRYKQAGNTSVKYSTGIGLAFCKIAIEQHNGKIGIISKEGVGTSVWFTVPYVQVKNVQKTTVETVKQDLPVLSNSEKEQLSVFYRTLHQTEITDYTKFMSIFKKIESKKLGNLAWREALVSSVINCNEQKFKQLIGCII